MGVFWSLRNAGFAVEMAAGRCYETVCPAGLPVRVLQSQLLDEETVVDAVPIHGAVHFIVGENSSQLGGLAKFNAGNSP